jgi:hypothetical protein
MCRKTLVKLSIIILNENPFSGSRVRRTNKHDEEKKIATFHYERTKTENRIVLTKDEHMLRLHPNI